MRVSSDLIFLGKDKKVVIYNYFINRAIMVNKDSAHFIKYNMGKCIETNMIVDENLKILKETVTQSKIAIAGGIDLDTLREIVPLKPDLVIVGSAIIRAENPLLMARTMRNIMKEAE